MEALWTKVRLHLTHSIFTDQCGSENHVRQDWSLTFKSIHCVQSLLDTFVQPKIYFETSCRVYYRKIISKLDLYGEVTIDFQLKSNLKSRDCFSQNSCYAFTFNILVNEYSCKSLPFFFVATGGVT